MNTQAGTKLLFGFIAVATLAFALPEPTAAQDRQPAIEYSSLLDAFTVKFRGQNDQGKTGGVLFLNQKHDITGVFFPENAMLDFEVLKSGGSQPVWKQNCVVQKGSGVFSMISAGGPEGYVFTEEGDYVLRFLLNGEVITKMPFNVIFEKSGDDFDPMTYTFVDGDWSNLSYLSYSADNEVSPLEFHTWTRKVVFTTTPEPGSMAVTLLQGEEVVAVTSPGTVAWPEWQTRSLVFAFPSNQGGQVFNNTDLMKRSGKHTVRVDLDGEPHQYFNFEVQDGKIVGHERQAMEYSQREDWLCPRRIRLGMDFTAHTFWMERSDSADNGATGKVAVPTASTKSNWVANSDIDPERRFELKHTNVRIRKDMPISIGDGIVVFATGSQGVGYFVVGEDRPRSIKDGQSFRGDLFFACGKRIMMANRNNVTVFSTEVERSVEIPADEIFLNYQKHSMYGPRMVDADGYLVATVNEPAKLKTKTIINVLDVSGDNRPIVIPINNSDFELRDVTSIRVNASAGKVAVASKRLGAIYVADVAPNATFRKYDISGYDSYGEENMVLTDSHILYTDAAGFANVRMLDLESGAVTMPDNGQYGGGWGPIGASNGSAFVWAVKVPRNSWAIGGANAQPLENAGSESSFEGAGRFGDGRSMAMAADGTVFIAGTRSISTSSCLQAAQNGAWKMIVGANGNPIPAIDVVVGNSMIVFKTGEPSTSSEVSLSYATFGSNVSLPDYESAAQQNQPDRGTQTQEEQDDNLNSVSAQITGIDRAFLENVLESEATIFNALKQSLGEDEARKRSREASLNSFEAGDRQHLIEEYKKSWK